MHSYLYLQFMIIIIIIIIIMFLKMKLALHLFLGRAVFLRPFGLYFNACFGTLFVSMLCTCCSDFFLVLCYFLYCTLCSSRFGSLEVSCWPLVPKFAVSNPAEAVGFFRAKKNPQHAFRMKGSKAVCPMSHICGM